jgi:hypothetical protein
MPSLLEKIKKSSDNINIQLCNLYNTLTLKGLGGSPNSPNCQKIVIKYNLEAYFSDNFQTKDVNCDI